MTPLLVRRLARAPRFRAPASLALVLLCCALAGHAPRARATVSASVPPGSVDTLRFSPAPADTDSLRVNWVDSESVDDDSDHPRHADNGDLYPHSPFGEGILTDQDEWRLRVGSNDPWPQPIGDYNRVDRLALGLAYQIRPEDPMAPRIGARLSYSFGRERTLYGVQIEQPLMHDGWLALGGSMTRRTDHSELQQTPDLENSLNLLFGRNDNRDYFERTGFGAYVSSRLGDITTASLRVRNDSYHSLPLKGGITSIFWKERELRDNPEIDEGESHTISLQFERLSQRVVAPKAGTYHFVSIERGGGGMKGDFDYGRALADVRSVLRVSPATTLAMRLVGGSTFSGTLPRQREFTLGGFDGLRAHAFAAYRGNQMALAQGEYTISLWRLGPADWMDGGIDVMVFGDAGTAWSSPGNNWNLGSQRIGADAGFGIGTNGGGFRVYFGRDLQNSTGDFLVTARLQRPF